MDSFNSDQKSDPNDFSRVMAAARIELTRDSESFRSGSVLAVIAFKDGAHRAEVDRFLRGGFETLREQARKSSKPINECACDALSRAIAGWQDSTYGPLLLRELDYVTAEGEEAGDGIPRHYALNQVSGTIALALAALDYQGDRSVLERCLASYEQRYRGEDFISKIRYAIWMMTRDSHGPVDYLRDPSNRSGLAYAACALADLNCAGARSELLEAARTITNPVTLKAFEEADSRLIGQQRAPPWPERMIHLFGEMTPTEQVLSGGETDNQFLLKLRNEMQDQTIGALIEADAPAVPDRVDPPKPGPSQAHGKVKPTGENRGDLEPPYTLISWSEYVERFKPTYYFNYRDALQEAADRLQIRLYQSDGKNAVHFHRDLSITCQDSFCAVVAGDLVVDGSIRVANDHDLVFLHVQGNTRAERLILCGEGWTCIEGDAEIDTGVLVMNRDESAPRGRWKTGSALLVKGAATAKVLIKSNATALFHGALKAYAIGDYGFCSLDAFPPQVQYRVPFHEFVFSNSLNIAAPPGLFDEDGIIEGVAEEYLADNRDALKSLQLAQGTGEKGESIELHSATLAYDEMADFLKEKGVVPPSQCQKDAADLSKKEDWEGIIAQGDRWLANTDDPYCFKLLASAYQKTRKFRECETWARRSLEKLKSHNGLLTCLLYAEAGLLGRLEEAWKDWQRFKDAFQWTKAGSDDVLQLVIFVAMNTGRTHEVYQELAPRLRTVRGKSPDFWFNAACLASRTGFFKDAVHFAWRALKNGKPRKDFDADTDFDSIRQRPAFQAVLALEGQPFRETSVFTKKGERLEIAIDSLQLKKLTPKGAETQEFDNPADALTDYYGAVAEAETQGYRRQAKG